MIHLILVLLLTAISLKSHALTCFADNRDPKADKTLSSDFEKAKYITVVEVVNVSKEQDSKDKMARSLGLKEVTITLKPIEHIKGTMPNRHLHRYSGDWMKHWAKIGDRYLAVLQYENGNDTKSGICSGLPLTPVQDADFLLKKFLEMAGKKNGS